MNKLTKIVGTGIIAAVLVFGVVGNVAAQEAAPTVNEVQVISGTPVERAKQRLIIEVMRRIEAAKAEEGLTEELAAAGMHRAIESFDLEISLLQQLSVQRRTSVTPQDITEAMNNAYRAFTNQIREYGNMNVPQRSMRSENLSERDYDVNTRE
jgi:hypothetical protein